MNTEKIRKLMSKFSIEELKYFMGEKTYNSLIEWKADGQFEFTKKQLSNMIFTINGLKLLKQQLFRLKLIERLSLSELNRFEALFNVSFNDKHVLCKRVAASPWKKNPVPMLLAEILELPESIFDKPEKLIESVTSISTYDKFYELLDYQYVIRQRILTNLNSGVLLNRMLVHMPTGTGKTKTTMHTLTNYFTTTMQKKGLIIWVAHTVELLQQAYETFLGVWKHLGQGETTVYKLWGKNNPSISENDNLNGVMFCGIQKLCSMMRISNSIYNTLKKNCRLIVFDEAHKAAAPETSVAINELMRMESGYRDRSLIGLTATPGRSTEYSFDNSLLVSMFGNRIIRIDTQLMNEMSYDKLTALNTPVETDIIKFFQDKRILAKVKKEELTYSQSFTEEQIGRIKDSLNDNGFGDFDFSKKALENIGRNRERNQEIMKKLRILAEQQIPTILFACSVEHGQLLSAMLSIEGIANALVTGEMSPQEREEAIRNFKDSESPINIIINYEVLTTGFDSTNIKCVFIARPTQSVVLYSQMIGRGLRGPHMGGNEECLLVDVKDNIYRYDENRAFSHFNNYWIN